MGLHYPAPQDETDNTHIQSPLSANVCIRDTENQ